MEHRCQNAEMHWRSTAVCGAALSTVGGGGEGGGVLLQSIQLADFTSPSGMTLIICS